MLVVSRIDNKKPGPGFVVIFIKSYKTFKYKVSGKFLSIKEYVA
jgi:hypothetical protein